jgi:hypothetical protein
MKWRRVHVLDYPRLWAELKKWSHHQRRGKILMSVDMDEFLRHTIDMPVLVEPGTVLGGFSIRESDLAWLTLRWS